MSTARENRTAIVGKLVYTSSPAYWLIVRCYIVLLYCIVLYCIEYYLFTIKNPGSKLISA